jgi:hypothetical protein
MHRSLQELEAEVLSLPVEARGRLTRRLIDSLEPSNAELRQLGQTRGERTPSVPKGPLTERGGLLLVSAPLEGPWVDHRTIRDEYLDEILDPQG